MTACGCLLYDSAVSRLLRDVWLGDEVIHAFLLLIASRSDIVAIDPLLIQTPASFTIPQYPIRDRTCYVPLHMRNGTHWGLGVFDVDRGTICVYDSYAHLYGYSSQLLGRSEPSLFRLWDQITDKPLMRIYVAGRDLVHRQIDGFNCGIFVCIYAERLIHGLPTKSEEPLRDFLLSARQHVHHCLAHSFTVSDRVAGETAPLPRIFNYMSAGNYPLHFQVNNDSLNVQFPTDSLRTIEPFTPSSLTAPLSRRAKRVSRSNISCVSRVDHSTEHAKHTPLSRERPPDDASHSSEPFRNVSIMDAEPCAISGFSAASGIQLEEFTVEDIVFFLQVSFEFTPDVHVIHTSIPFPDLCAQPSRSSAIGQTKTSSCLTLIVFYTNQLGRVCAAVFKKSPTRSHALVFDFSLAAIDGPTQDHLQRTGDCYGFHRSQLRMSKICSKREQFYFSEIVVTSLCVLQYITANKESAISLSHTLIDQHRCSVSAMLHSLPKGFHRNVAHGVVLYMRACLISYDGVEFVDMFSECTEQTLPSKSIGTSKAEKFVAVYPNVNGDPCGVFVQRFRNRCRGIVFDFSAPEIRSDTRAYLKSLSNSHGFMNCCLSLSPCLSGKLLSFDEIPIALSFCVLRTVHRGIHDTISLQPKLLQQHRHKISQFLSGSCTVPFADDDVTPPASSPVATSAKTKHTERYAASNSCTNVVPVYLGVMSSICTHCHAVSFRGEAKSICCNGGLNMVPEHVCSGTKDAAMNWFWERVACDEKLFYMLRAVNNLVAFAGIAMHLRTFDHVSGQIPLIVQGSVDVGICHMNPDSERASFAQLYICDDFKLRHSVRETTRQWKSKVDFVIIEKIIASLRKINVIAQSYMSMYELYLSTLDAHCYSSDDIPPKILMNLKHKRDIPDDAQTHTHEGLLNVPRIDNQVAAIYICRNGVMPSHEELDRGLRVFCRGGRAIAAHHNNNIDALCYPLYFPRGEQSYIRESLPKRSAKDAANAIFANNSDPNSSSRDYFFSEDDVEQGDYDVSSKTLSRAEFYRFMLARRGCILHHRFLGSGKLLSQFVLHVFSRIEADRLAAIGLNSTELRTCHASSLYTYIDGRLQEKGYKLGKLVNLPKNFVGSRLWYDALYHNAMCVAQREGKPDIFLTFTGNQDWLEIVENLPTRFDSWMTEPLLCARVFRMRLRSLIKEIINKQIFGEVLALQYSIEYQKRGMPHAHILITLREKLNTPSKIDDFISAELPPYPSSDDPERSQKLLLFSLVTKFMIHGPCNDRPDLACRANSEDHCSKRYPKKFRESTELTDDGYPLYRRRDDSRRVAVGRKKTTVASNQDVIPYNAYLLLRYQCHINVECCCSIMAFKYIFKYIYKGPDQVIFELLHNVGASTQSAHTDVDQSRAVDVDMRKVYLDARFLSQIEGAYRLLAFPTQYSMHTVISLSPHLPGKEPIYFRGVPARQITPVSKLHAYFDLVKRSARAAKLTWIEVAEQFRFNGRNYVPYKRKGRRVARLWPVNPKMAELYALRKLLFHTRGATSFEDLRTVEGIVYNSFMEAAQVAGFIETENEWEKCLRSACTTEMPSAIRRLFAHILLYCRPTNPETLWHLFKHEMRARTKVGITNPTLLDARSLNHIEKIISSNGMSLKDCGLLIVKDSLICSTNRETAISEDLVEDEIPHAEDPSTLTNSQRFIIDSILLAARTPKTAGNRLFFIDGKAGCGKTYTLNALITALEAEGKRVLTIASTGIAAILLKNGRTAHSMFSLPVKQLHSRSVANVDASSAMGQLLNAVDVIIWDEISMQSRFAVECAERLLRDVASSECAHMAFGGVTMVLGGDWCQFLPVIQGATRQETINSTFKFSHLWSLFKSFVLDKNMRLHSDDGAHGEWLISVGEGSQISDDGEQIELPSCICMSNENDVIDWMYTSTALQNPETLANMALLTVRNCDAEDLNQLVLRKLLGDPVELVGIDTPATEEDGTAGLPCDNEEYFHRLTPSGLPPYTLKLKPGCIAMLLRNLDVSAQLCNGTRLVVISIMCEGKLLYCKNLCTGAFCFITRVRLDYSDEKSGISFCRFQFPIRLSFCITINKSQGQTFDKVGVVLRTPSFAHGSTYVALSRSRTRNGLRVTRNWAASVPIVPKVRNVVYKELFN